MTPERWKRITEVYSDVCDLPPGQQEQRLEELCAGDIHLSEQVRKILRDDPSEGKGFVDNPPLGDALARFTTTGRRLEAGEILAGRFAIVRHLGSGGMGEVYEAEDRHLHTHVAIKLIRRDIAGHPEAAARFRREITLARQITHRSVCRVYEYFPASTTTGGDHVDFLTMELLSGETLAELMEREAPMPLPRAYPILEQLTSGLDAAHAAGVLHRDLKGSNVFLARDTNDFRVVITDFGLARSADGGDSLSTGSAWGGGTPLYMSPEQLEGGELGPQSDVYSLGVIMYQMATGVAPLQGHSPLQIAVKRIKEQPKPPRHSNPNVDPVWESAILKCLALRPDQRFPSGSAVLESLGKRNPFTIRIPAKPVLVAAAVLAVALAGWWAVRQLRVPPLRPDVARWFREGEVALADGSIARASKLFERALEIDPSYLSARCRLAESYIELDMRDRAQEQILQSVGASPRSAEERLLCEGVKSTLTGQWDQALAAAKDRGNAQLDEARWNERAGRNTAAAALYEAVIKADNAQPGAMLRLANIRIREGRNTDATTLLDRAGAAYQTLGNAEGQGEVALSRVALARDVASGLGAAEEAERYGRESGSQWLIVRAMLARAQRLQQSGNLAEFRRLTLEATSLAERENFGAEAVNGFLDLGSSAIAQGKPEEAIPEYDKALTLAVRYRARRAEAKANLAIAQLHMVLNHPQESGPFLDKALAFYRSTGDSVQAAKTLRFRGDQMEKFGRFDEARAGYLEALAASTTPGDILLSRQRLALLARQQTRYEESVERYGEIIDSFEAQGSKVNAQNYRIERAKALLMIGRFSEAAADLERVRSGPPASDKIQWQLDGAQSSMEFQQLKFTESIARWESMRAAAARSGRMIEEKALRYELCPKYAEAGRPAEAAPLCADAKKEFGTRAAQLVTPHYAMAQVYLARREPRKAIPEARLAVQYGEKINAARDIWYSLLILTEALHAARDPEWKQTRDRARKVLADFNAKIGEQAARNYFNRPIIAKHHDFVEKLQ